MNRNVAVLPKERWPAAGKSPYSAKPSVDEWRRENWPVGMVVEVDANVDSRNPAEDHSRSQHEGYAGPRAGDAGHFGMQVESERAGISRQADEMEKHTVPVLRMREKPPGLRRCAGGEKAYRWDHINLRAAAIATTVTPRLTQGPQSAAPRMITIANSGKKDRPKISAVCEWRTRARRSILSSFPLRLGCGGSSEQRRIVSAR